VLALAGGLSVLFGYKARIGAWLLVLFLVPVTLMMHAFWTVPDAGIARIQEAMFMKNLSMLGAALMITYMGAGPVSIDERRSDQNQKERPSSM
jgi:putative oxidoreductase